MEFINHLLLKGFLLAWMFVNFTPLQSFLDKQIKPYLFKYEYISNALSCLMCLSFWMTLLISANIFTAIAAAFLAYTYTKIISSFKTYL